MTSFPCAGCGMKLQHDGSSGTFACPQCGRQFTWAQPSPPAIADPTAGELPRHRPARGQPAGSPLAIGMILIVFYCFCQVVIDEWRVWRVKHEFQQAFDPSGQLQRDLQKNLKEMTNPKGEFQREFQKNMKAAQEEAAKNAREILRGIGE